MAIRNLTLYIGERSQDCSPIFLKENNMFLTILGLLALLVVGLGLWFLIEFIRYVLSGQYELDQRLQSIARR